MDKKRVILIEDETNISRSLSIILKNEGYEVTVCETGREGLVQYASHDLLVLDLMLPDMSGLDILQEIRSKSSSFPVLIVSAKNTEQDLVLGLQLGADDYITKPFSIQELILRIKRTLERKDLYEQRFQIRKDSFELRIGKFLINFESLSATTTSGEISLTRQEADILIYLNERNGKVVSRSELITHIWGHDYDYESRTIDNFIVRFRKYFEENPKKPVHFITKRGAGYIFNV